MKEPELPSSCFSNLSECFSPCIHLLETSRVDDVKYALNTKKSNIREGTIRLEEGSSFLCIMQSLVKDGGTLQYHDLETTKCGLCELIIL